MGRKPRSWTAGPLISSGDRFGRAREQARPRRHLEDRRAGRVDRDGGIAEFLPAERGFRLDVEIDFESPAIGRQRRVLDLDPSTSATKSPAPGFRLRLRHPEVVAGGLCARLFAREFGRYRWRRRPEIPRVCVYADEFVRHEALDADGDLSLAGAPIVGLTGPIARGTNSTRSRSNCVRASLGL